MEVSRAGKLSVTSRFKQCIVQPLIEISLFNPPNYWIWDVFHPNLFFGTSNLLI